MKSNKQRKAEIKNERIERANRFASLPKISPLNALPRGAVAADHSNLTHINTYGFLPEYYFDKPFVCRNCGSQEVWTAKQQKWWYEVAKAHIDSKAVRCRPCRLIEKNRINEARRVSLEGLERKLATK